MSPKPSNVSNENSGITRQLLAVILISTSTINAGMLQGWLSPMTDYFKSADSPVGIMNNIEIGYLASVPVVAMFIGGFVYGYVADTFGRKIGLFLIGVPSVVGGLLVTFATTKMMLYVGRSLTGVAGVIIFMGPMYLSEAVHESIRGTLISSISISLYVGIVTSYTLGKYLTYRQFNSIMVALPIIHLCTTIFLPETPYYLISKSKIKEALSSLTWLRGDNTVFANAELEKIQSPQSADKIGFLQTLKMRETRKALVIAVMLMTLQTFSGIHIIISYASIIFAETGSPLSPDDSAIFSSLTLLMSTLVCMMLIDRVGRKPLLYFSHVFGFVCHSIISVALFLRLKGFVIDHLDWISIISIGTFIFTYGIGLGAVPAVISNEVSPVEIKPYVSATTVCAATISVISVLQAFPIIFDSVGMYWNFVIPAIANFLGLFFAWFCVPETKGKSLIEISNYLKGSSSND